MAKLFTRTELETRNTKDDALFVINNVVYDVTQFLEDHPGGMEILLDNAGKDASQCFHDVGHSQDAKEWMKRFEVGEVVEADRREAIRPKQEWQSGTTTLTWRGLVAVWVPPLTLAAAALLLYGYLFG